MSPEREKEVPVLGAKGLTIPRALWDEAWIAYCKEYSASGTVSQHERLLEQGFWISELDHFVPNWRPVAQELERRGKRIEALEERIKDLRINLECTNRQWNENGATCLEVGAKGAYKCDHCDSIEADDRAALTPQARESAEVRKSNG